MSLSRYGRHWAVYDQSGALVCLCVYKKGAHEVIRRMEASAAAIREVVEAASAYAATAAN